MPLAKEVKAISELVVASDRIVHEYRERRPRLIDLLPMR